MTITVQPVRNEYTANAGQTIFNYTFKIFEATDLNVYITPDGDVANDSADLTTAYTVSGIGDEDGGTITLTTGATLNDLVTIVSNVPSSRTTNYLNNGDFKPETVNADFDRVVSIAKKIEDAANRTALLQQSQQGTKPLSLPKPTSGKILRWNNSENGFDNVDAADLGAIADPIEFLQAIARSINVLDSQVIYSTDTATVLDNVLYIYDAPAQTTWGVPELDSTGKTIVSVDGSTLNTTGGTGSNTYTLETYTPYDEANSKATFDEFGTAELKSFDIYVKQEKVNLLRGVPNSEIPAILNGTSTYDLSTIVQSAVNYCSSNHAKLELPHGQMNFTNILLPAGGIEVVGVHTQASKIINSSTSTPVFRTAGGSRNLWTLLDKFKIITPDGGTSAINIKSFEHLLLGMLEISTAPAERGSGTSSGILIERDINTDFGFYLDISQAIKVDKHGYGLRLKGVSGANCNANAIRGLITNDNTNAGVRLDFCTGVKLKDGSAEINKNNIEIFDSISCAVNGYYMERPETHDIQIIRGDNCKVTGNPHLSSAGAGVNFNGSPVDTAGRAVYIQESVGVDVSGNGFIDPWATAADVTVTANSSACTVKDNRKRERVNGFTQYTVEVEDLAGDTIVRNFQKTAGGNVRVKDESTAVTLGQLLTTEATRELKIGDSADAKIYSDTNTPEGVVTASRGSIFLRTNGGGGFTFYVKETGDATNTGWVAK